MADIKPGGTFIPDDIRDLYEIHNYRNAAQVLATGCVDEFAEILEGLRSFRMSIVDIRSQAGMNRTFQSASLRSYAARVGTKRELRATS